MAAFAAIMVAILAAIFYMVANNFEVLHCFNYKEN
jgi:hypothetical protein